MEELLKRYEKNPILAPKKSNPWEPVAVFNCGAFYKDGLVHLLYRAVDNYEDYISRLGYAVSSDGFNFERNNKPVFEPRIPDEWAYEDPRITELDGRFYITYVVHSKPVRQGGPAQTALASTKDFKHFERHGIITPPGTDDRDVVLFPEKIDGKYVMLHRPSNWTKENVYRKNGRMYLKMKGETIRWPLEEIPSYFPQKPSIWIAYSTDLKNWFGHRVVAEPAFEWENLKIGAGPPPIKIDEGWLSIHHAVSTLPKGYPEIRRWDGNIQQLIYTAGAMLLDLKDPTKVIARTKKPILVPKTEFEIYGDVPWVVFPEGAVVIEDKLFVYYGAGDKTCCVATCKLRDLLKLLFES